MPPPDNLTTHSSSLSLVSHYCTPWVEQVVHASGPVWVRAIASTARASSDEGNPSRSWLLSQPQAQLLAHPSLPLPTLHSYFSPSSNHCAQGSRPWRFARILKVPSPLLAAPKPTPPGNPILSRVEKTTRAYLPLLASGLGPWGHPPHYLAFASWPGS